VACLAAYQFLEVTVVADAGMTFEENQFKHASLESRRLK
jgi:hypothetical protein